MKAGHFSAKIPGQLSAEINIHGTGRADGKNIGWLYQRGLWGADLDDIDVREISGNGWELGSAGTVAPDDEVDNTSMIRLRKVRMQGIGKSGYLFLQARPTMLDMANCEVRRAGGWAINGALVNSRIVQSAFASCASDASDGTHCGIRLRDSLTTSRARNTVIGNNIFEDNRNCDIDVVMMRGLTLGDNAHNAYPESGAWRAVKLRTGAAAGTRNINIINLRLSDFAVPKNGDPKSDVFMIEIDAGVTDVNVIGMSYDYNSSHIKATSAARLNVIGCPANIDVQFAGALPVDTFVNGVCRGSLSSRVSFTPVLAGSAASGAVTGGSQTASYRIDGDEIVFSVNYTQTSHTGTGSAVIHLDALPNNFSESVPVELYFEGLTYTSPPQALATGGSKTVLLRQAASGSSYTPIAMPAGAATIRLKGRVRRH